LNSVVSNQFFSGQQLNTSELNAEYYFPRVQQPVTYRLIHPSLDLGTVDVKFGI
jgi:hypothetical protein